MNDLSMGIPGVGVIHPGTHLCALYSGADERERLLGLYMQEGLRRGDQCVCLIDDLDPVGIRQRTDELAGPGGARRSADLGLYPAPDAYLRAGQFRVEQNISSLVTERASPTGRSGTLLRAAGEMSCEPHQPGAKQLSDYESAVTQILAELPTLFLCLYDLDRCGVSTLVNVLRIHSKVLVDGAVLDNPQCLAPTDYPKLTPDAVARYPLTRIRTGWVAGGDQWLSLSGAEVRVAELVASGMTNRAMAEELIVSPHTVDAHLKHMYVKLGIHSRVELTVLALQHGVPST